MATVTADKSVDDSGPKIEIIRAKKPLEYNPWWMVTSLLLTVAIAVFLYIVPDYLFLEQITRDMVLVGLNLLGAESGVTTQIFPIISQPDYTQFGEASVLTPGIVIPSQSVNYSAFWIVKACTGMQAGAILIALILITPIPSKYVDTSKHLHEMSFRERFRVTNPILYNSLYKLTVIAIFFIVLFVVNTIRITFHLWLVWLGFPFSFAHDDLSKPIGFVGTLIFAYIIEKTGIPIIDTFADWMDSAYLGIKGIYNKVL